MLAGFKKFASDAKSTMWVTFGRFQPPTVGHGLLLDRLKSFSLGSAGYRIYASQSCDPKKNPLNYKTKIEWMRKMWPDHKSAIEFSPAVITTLSVAEDVYKDGYTRLGFVVGSDRTDKTAAVLQKYNGVKTVSGFYNFESIEVRSAGVRDPDDEGVTGMSATKMRTAAAAADIKTFKLGLPPKFAEAKRLMDDVRAGMGL